MTKIEAYWWTNVLSTMDCRWHNSSTSDTHQNFDCSEHVNQSLDHHSEDPGGCSLYNSLLEIMPSNPPCRIQMVPQRGAGMVALRKLYPGDLILIEPPLIFVPDMMDGEATAALLEVVVAGMSETQRKAVLCLNDCKNPDDPDFLGRFYTNAMSYGEDAVLCPIMARANHSCRPNAEFVTRKDLGVNHLRAIYTIEQGEEVEINYMLMETEGLEGRAVRQAYLEKCYDFKCICSACNMAGDQFEADEGLRDSLRQMKERGIDLLTDKEVDVFVAGLYTIQAKLSYIFEVVEQVDIVSIVIIILHCHRHLY